MQAQALGVLEAALWGLAGGGAAALVSLIAAIKAAGYRWPWRGKDRTDQEIREHFWARFAVLGGSLLLGSIVAAAAHGQMSGPWPAFLLGVGAEASVRGLLAGVEVAVRKEAGGGEQHANPS
ncbi:hypothetical protein [Nonomuraea sp. SYSU D8015]|uniref:hypothetical protein n=1 Tax=Nonomuraea sp. SYSU D8015 TaxID=2593644 RepID=UPI0016614440|nr:hypothetical protein [Nonomuraea sp. SYSU D8015]